MSTLGLRVYREARDGLSPSFPAAPELLPLRLACDALGCLCVGCTEAESRQARAPLEPRVHAARYDYFHRLAPQLPAREEPEPQERAGATVLQHCGWPLATSRGCTRVVCMRKAVIRDVGVARSAVWQWRSRPSGAAVWL